MRRLSYTFAICACAFPAGGTTGASGAVVALHVQMKVGVRSNVHLSFRAAPCRTAVTTTR